MMLLTFRVRDIKEFFHYLFACFCQDLSALQASIIASRTEGENERRKRFSLIYCGLKLASKTSTRRAKAVREELQIGFYSRGLSSIENIINALIVRHMGGERALKMVGDLTISLFDSALLFFISKESYDSARTQENNNKNFMGNGVTEQSAINVYKHPPASEQSNPKILRTPPIIARLLLKPFVSSEF